MGKTLTADAVAKKMRLLLIKFDIGVHASSFQQSINQILELTGRWKAVLLLDECDVFVEAFYPGP